MFLYSLAQFVFTTAIHVWIFNFKSPSIAVNLICFSLSAYSSILHYMCMCVVGRSVVRADVLSTTVSRCNIFWTTARAHTHIYISGKTRAFVYGFWFEPIDPIMCGVRSGAAKRAWRAFQCGAFTLHGWRPVLGCSVLAILLLRCFNCVCLCVLF